jgi:GMP synthase (glutamine-hydrolysing)
MKTALILTHEPHEGPGQFGDILAAHGYDRKIIYTPKEDLKEIDPLAADLVLVMGGPMGVYETEEYPFLKDEIKFLAARIAADLPTLGVCLGAQLIAAALGEKVFKGKPGQEIGWNPLKLTGTAKKHPVRHLDPANTNMFHWHGDTFELPKGAELLASSSMYPNQVFGFGKKTLALQCHPEMTYAMIKDWATTLDDRMGGSKITGSHAELDSQTEKNIATMNRQSKLFFEEWLESVGL